MRVLPPCAIYPKSDSGVGRRALVPRGTSTRSSVQHRQIHALADRLIARVHLRVASSMVIAASIPLAASRETPIASTTPGKQRGPCCPPHLVLYAVSCDCATPTPYSVQSPRMKCHWSTTPNSPLDILFRSSPSFPVLAFARIDQPIVFCFVSWTCAAMPGCCRV
ncbi:hypothetical protein BDU57DRAFT_86698 [Ampelomyces quisqualis]|uniref:Uncharacterized protein n=1 Tax=Ampelomyces quisqualis TaxID=50730 RepID=A0A6A5QAE2_AMPQU|nr:hypothetical protein BDU57DRAFT_86698 [Ampelomyces quisqualis]